MGLNARLRQVLQVIVSCDTTTTITWSEVKALVEAMPLEYEELKGLFKEDHKIAKVLIRLEVAGDLRRAVISHRYSPNIVDRDALRQLNYLFVSLDVIK